MPRLMLDSGAFSVWTKGETIDIDDYIRFCLDNPGVSYYIVLDVIAGGNRRDSDIESAEQATWDNYQYMLRQGLPMEKVMPVVHRGLGHTKWLEKYIDFGSPYIGFGQVGFFGNLASQKRDLDPISKVIFDSTGKAIVRTHGLAVTSFPLMKAFRWHSVDSASWVKQAAFGAAYIAAEEKDGWTFSESPLQINFSPKSPSVNDKFKHIDYSSPTFVERVRKYLKAYNIPEGAVEIVDVEEGYKLQKLEQGNELWNNKDALPAPKMRTFLESHKTRNKSIVRPTEAGLRSCLQHRYRANAMFMRKANEVIDVGKIYFAGCEGGIVDFVERNLENRLMSYAALRGLKENSKTLKRFHWWCERTGGEIDADIY